MYGVVWTEAGEKFPGFLLFVLIYSVLFRLKSAVGRRRCRFRIETKRFLPFPIFAFRFCCE
jgi:hypothetical protein